MVYIKVGIQGYRALIDTQDHARVSQYRWWLARMGRMTYARTKIDGHTVLLHNFIMQGKGFDHKNRYGLDCRRRNLRSATKSQNAANALAHSDNRSGIKGVWWNSRDKCWHAQICYQGNRKHLGCFASAPEAGAAYKKAAKKYFGAFAV